MRKGPVLPALFFALPVADVLPVVLPAPSLGKHCRPRGAAGQDRLPAPRSRPVADVLPFRPVVLPTCCAAGQLPAGCPTLPARHSGSVAGPWCCRSRSAPRSRPRGAADVLRSRPVTREALPARGAADVLRCRSRSAPRSRPVAGPYCRRNPCNPTFSILSSGIPRLLRLPLFDSG
jgi:hypothetical protein